MYRTAVHNLDAEFTLLEMATSNAFFLVSSRFCTCTHFTHAVTDEINPFRVSGELCLQLQFRTRSDRQHELCNYLSFWWYSGLCFKITNLEKLSMQNYPACKYVN